MVFLISLCKPSVNQQHQRTTVTQSHSLYAANVKSTRMECDKSLKKLERTGTKRQASLFCVVYCVYRFLFHPFNLNKEDKKCTGMSISAKKE